MLEDRGARERYFKLLEGVLLIATLYERGTFLRECEYRSSDPREPLNKAPIEVSKAHEA